MMDGQRVLLTEPHLYAGFLGRVVQYEYTLIGHLYLVHLDSGLDCYASYYEMEKIEE